MVGSIVRKSFDRKTVFHTAVTFTDTSSKHNGRSANESTTNTFRKRFHQ